MIDFDLALSDGRGSYPNSINCIRICYNYIVVVMFLAEIVYCLCNYDLFGISLAKI